MELINYLKQFPQAAIAFSGGVDSAYLLYAALQSGIRVRAYYVRSEFQPRFEYDDAVRLAEELGADMTVIDTNVLADGRVRANPADRCYYCKQGIFGRILEGAAADGFDVIMDGTNASDDAGDRPGMRALKEMQVLSPLRVCGLTKGRIRELSREAGLFTWNKPSYACLATRIPAGEDICIEKLRKVEMAEEFMKGLGFEDFRVRTPGGDALIQLKEAQLPLYRSLREKVEAELQRHFNNVILDSKTR